MKQSQKYPKQTNKIQIVKNKEIIIYQNGEEFKRFKQTETKELNENEMYILDFIINKYSIYEVPPRSSKLEENDFDFESTDEILKKSSIKKNDAGNTPYYEDRRKTEPHLKEFFQDVEDENGEDIIENTGKEIITETKKLKKDIKTTEDVKVPIQRKNKNYHYEEQNVDINYENEEDEEENEEEPPQYVIEAESYTSPSIRFIDERKAEHELLNGIKTSLMINGEEKTGILFLGPKEEIIFLSFEDQKETVISLNNLKRIYFNIRGSSNLINYKKKTNNERFIQFVELNNKKTDIKFSNDTEMEYFIKGLIQIFKNKSTPLDKNTIYEKVKKFFTYSSKKEEVKNSSNKSNSNKYNKNYSNSNNYNQNYSYSKNYNKNEKIEKNPFQKKNVTKTGYYNKRNEKSCDSKNNNNNDENNNYYYKKNYSKTENYIEKESNVNAQNENNENYVENEINVQNENNEDYVQNENNENYYENQNYYENENAENYIENQNQNYENNYQNIKSYNNKNITNNGEKTNDDDFITTTVTEVFKDGKLINEETKEEYQGVVTTLHSYSPDIGEYQEYLKKSTLRKSNPNDDINRSLDRVRDTNKFKSTYKSKKY